MKLILPHPSNAYYKFSYATKPCTQATQNAQGNTQATNLVASAPAHHPLTRAMPTSAQPIHTDFSSVSLGGLSVLTNSSGLSVPTNSGGLSISTNPSGLSVLTNPNGLSITTNPSELSNWTNSSSLLVLTNSSRLLVPTNPCQLRLPANLCRLQLDQSAPTPARSVCASPDLNPLHQRLRPKTRTSKIKSAIKEAPTKDCATRQWKHRPTTAKPSPKPFSEKLYRALSRILEGHVGTRCPGHLGYVDFLERLGVGNPCWRLTWRRQSGTMSAELTQC
ncbi:hypothetical protein BHE74_00019563 [Ensete ventricosum]|nr:hypothetical protein BHE74_00019563 [Ensete ventricosum]